MKRNPTSYVILGLLSIQGNLSGYDMRKAVQGSIGYFWAESYGQIYPALKQLTREKLIAQARRAAKGGRQRQEYVLTEAGRQCLRDWLALPFHNEPPRNEFLLKLFFAGEAAPGVALAHLKDLQERNRRMLDTLSRIEATVPPAPQSNRNLPYWMLSLGLGKALTRAALEWGEAAIAEFSARVDTPLPQAGAAKAAVSSDRSSRRSL